MPKINTEFVLQIIQNDEWVESIKNERLQPVIDRAIITKELTGKRQRILRRVTTVVDEEFISEIE